jgi:hypothetical protein
MLAEMSVILLLRGMKQFSGYVNVNPGGQLVDVFKFSICAYLQLFAAAIRDMFLLVLLRKTVVLGVKDKETSKLHFKSCWFNGS